MKTKSKILITCLFGSVFLSHVNAQSPATQDTPEAAQQRVAAKVERVTQAVQKLKASGRDISAIAKTMGEKVGPLLDTGKFVEAEAELDRVLEQLKQDGKSTATADDSKKAADPFATGHFPPELVFLAQDRIALTPEQLEVLRTRMEKTHDAGVAVKDLLTPEQLAKLGQLGLEIAKDHAVFVKLEEETGKRLTEKMERIKEGAQKLADSGRDPSDFLRAMEEKFKPLIDSGKVFEAETVLDRALEQLKQDAK